MTQIGEQGWNIGRMVPMVAGWPETVPGTTVDRQCGSSMQTNFNAAAAIWSGQLDLVVSGGVEMMSRVPMGSNGGDLSDKLFERWQIVPQGVSAEAIAEEWNLSREELDEFSLESHRRAIAAIDEGRFENEIVPVEVQNPHVGTLFAVDETPRRDTSLEALAALSPAFLPEGVVTAGSSSQICDGAAGVLVASERKASELGLEPRARFVSFGLAGVDPYRMLHGNPQACERALAKAGIGWDDVSVIEVNEAFASVVLQFVRDCGLEERMDDVNPNGGASRSATRWGDRRADHRDAGQRARAARRALRRGDDVHRLRPGDRVGHRARLRRIELHGERAVTAPGSASARVRRLAGDAHVVVIEVGPEGLVARHPAGMAQLFSVVRGSGWVSGADGERSSIAAGESVVWEPGEEHESGSEEGMTVLVVEAESLDL